MAKQSIGLVHGEVEIGPPGVQHEVVVVTHQAIREHLGKDQMGSESIFSIGANLI